jgi:hypothetical protein
VRQQLGGDTFARVRDGDLHVIAMLLECDVDLTLRRRELHGIRQEVPHHLAQTVRIGDERRQPALRLLDTDLHRFGLRRRRDRRNGRVDDVHDLHARHLHA